MNLQDEEVHRTIKEELYLEGEEEYLPEIVDLDLGFV